MNNNNTMGLMHRTLNLTGDILAAIIRIIIKSMLWIARRVLKRYFGIETPLYKMWWRVHSKTMQEKLDKAHCQSIYQPF